MTRTLVVAAKLPPDVGGIQTFAWELGRRLGTEDVVYAAPYRPGCEVVDAEAGFHVVRLPRMGMDTETALSLQSIARRYACDRAWFTSAGPLGLMGGALREAGVRRVVSSTHGHELPWARVPGGAAWLRRLAAAADVLTVLTPWAREQYRRVLGPGPRLELLSGGVDPARFGAVRHASGDRVVLHVGRLVPRKGQDVLVRAIADLDARLVLVGEGGDRRRLERLARRYAPGRVHLAGRVGAAELEAAYAAADVFAMPSRTRWAGLDVEGLGISALEAAAAGLPVIAGRSGGAPASVVPGRTGLVVDGADQRAVTAALAELLDDPVRAAAMGAAGRAWARDAWSWEVLAGRLAGLLEIDVAVAA